MVGFVKLFGANLSNIFSRSESVRGGPKVFGFLHIDNQKTSDNLTVRERGAQLDI